MRRTPRLLLLVLLALPGCSVMYPPVETVQAPAVGTPAPAPPPARGARVQLLGADDPAYGALAGNATGRSAPDAPERLLVVRDNAVVLDLGIQMVTAEDQATAPVQERVALADDASAAVIVRLERKPNARDQTIVTWLPAEDPQSAWKK